MRAKNERVIVSHINEPPLLRYHRREARQHRIDAELRGRTGGRRRRGGKGRSGGKGRASRGCRANANRRRVFWKLAFDGDVDDESAEQEKRDDRGLRH
jgi:hypothetical protein